MKSSLNDEHCTEVVIVGAGLCGLATAFLLHEEGRSVHVVEASGRPGGRIRSVFDKSTGDYLADLGPSWIWPAFQPVVQRWLERLNLEVFAQYDSGQTLIDYGPDQEAKAAFLPGQDGNFRVVGGPQALIDALIKHLPDDRISFEKPVRAIHASENGVEIQSGTTTFRANQVVMAIPPRIASQTIELSKALPTSLHQALDMMPTWMAPHAKFVAVYDEPFWRSQGLSGRIASRAGPIVECHDHCSPDESVAALWGFIGWPHDMRIKMNDELEAHIYSQLKRCFGPNNPEPAAIYIQDWAREEFLTTSNDLKGPMNHPSVGPDSLRRSYFEGRVFFAGSETATQSPGLIEGALDAAERVANGINERCLD
ncbi:MAG: NAD(P)/FAD-dependent oxidoreductase [Pseudomonadota bacterium]